MGEHGRYNCNSNILLLKKRVFSFQLALTSVKS
nr:MAG TPA: hypothetical protein [Caudoviricetes sp.]DAR33704.1 MAG TPA: hypothetical protein [Caudoviricetes sp.]